MIKKAATKRSKKLVNHISALNFELLKIHPKTENQEIAFDLYEEGKNLILYGSAGSGKSFLSLYLALRDILDNGAYLKIIILRSAVASRDIGFLPGTEKEKISVYETPYKIMVNQLFNRDDSYDILKQKNIIQFESTSFLRGLTYDNTLVFVDEVENMTFGEIDTICTRLGEGSRLIIAGDIKQCDFNTRRETSGMSDILKITRNMDAFGFVEFTIDDCVRSGFAKEYLMAKDRLGY